MRLISEVNGHLLHCAAGVNYTRAMDPSERMIAELREQNRILTNIMNRHEGIIEELRGQTESLQDDIQQLRGQVHYLQRSLHDAMVTLHYTQIELDASNAELRRILSPLRDTTNMQENRRPALQEALVGDLIGMLETWDEARSQRGDETQPTLYRCSRCKTAVYSNQEEQIADWPRHREVCTPPGQAAEAVRAAMASGHC